MSSGEFKRPPGARLSDAARQDFLDKLDRSATAERTSRGIHRNNQRKDTRWAYRQSDIGVTIEHPAGGVSRLLLMSRNLSAGGISFLHSGFLYPGSRCQVALPKLDGQLHIAGGSIVTCRHVQGLVHEVCIKFERRIEPGQYITSPDSAGTDAPDSVEMPELHGRVLVVDDSEMDRNLLLHHLKIAGVHLTSVSTSGAALDTVKRDVVEIVLCDINLESMDGVEFITKLREAGFAGPIVVVTAETNEERITAAKNAGAAHLIAKPYTPDELFAIMVELHQKIGAVLTQSAIYSTADDQPGMTDLIGQYIEQARKAARKIEKITTDEGLGELRQVCLNIKGSASGYGFASVGTLAADIIKAIDSSPNVRAVSSQIRTLSMMCDRLRQRGSSTGTAVGAPGSAAEDKPAA
jgi:CheY-like chemotaxis protein